MGLCLSTAWFTSWSLIPVAILWTSLRSHWLTQSCSHPFIHSFIHSCCDSSILKRSCSRGQVRTAVSESLCACVCVCVCVSLTGMPMQASSANLLTCTPLGCCCGRCTPGNDPGVGSTQCKSFSISHCARRSCNSQHTLQLSCR